MTEAARNHRFWTTAVHAAAGERVILLISPDGRSIATFSWDARETANHIADLLNEEDRVEHECTQA